MVAEGFSAYPNAKKFSDFRKMLDKMGKKTDSVVTAFPDHTHFDAIMTAMQQRKHVHAE